MLKACKYSILNMQPKKHTEAVANVLLNFPLPLLPSFTPAPTLPNSVINTMSWQLLKFEFQSKNVLSFIHLLSHSLPFILLLARSNKLAHTRTRTHIDTYMHGVPTPWHLVSDISSEIPCKHKCPSHIFWSGAVNKLNASERPRNCINLDFIQLCRVLTGR